MSDCEQHDDITGAQPGQVRLHAEERVRQVMANATAKAESFCQDATSRALDVLANHHQRALDACRRIEAGSRISATVPDIKLLQRETSGRPQHHEIALRAYSKAEQRDFQAGQETDDWLSAERELLLGSRG